MRQVAAQPLAQPQQNDEERREHTHRPIPVTACRRKLQHLRGQVAGIGDLDVRNPAAGIEGRFELGHDESRVRRKPQSVDARHDLIAQTRIEMHAVSLEQELGRGVIAFGLDPLNFGEHASNAVAKRVRIGEHIVRLAVALADFDRVRMRHQPVHDRLAIAHVILFELRPFPNASQLHQRVARISLVLGAYDLGLILGRQQPELGEMRIGDEIQGDEIRARLLERRVLLLEQFLRLALDVVRHSAGSVAEHLVNLGRQLAGKRAPSLGAIDLVLVPGKFLPKRVERRLLRTPRSRSTARRTCCRIRSRMR